VFDTTFRNAIGQMHLLALFNISDGKKMKMTRDELVENLKRIVLEQENYSIYCMK
jgi:hypothetical protein